MGVYEPWDVVPRITRKPLVECSKNDVWRPLGARDMSIFAKHVFLQRSLGVVTIVGNSVENYVGWCSAVKHRSEGAKPLCEIGLLP